MTFLNPFLLWGFAGIAVPIAIHLLFRRRQKVVKWAAMRFLQMGMATNRRSMRLENFLLLLLRCLLLALLALALARPAIRKTGFGLIDKVGTRAEIAVLAIDASASMTQTDGIISSFEQARSAALAAVDSLPPGSSCSLFLASNILEPVIATPTSDLNYVRKMIREVQVSDRGSDLKPCFLKAIELLDAQPDAPHTGKSVYLFTDGQAFGWANADDIFSLLKTRMGKVRTTVVLTGHRTKQNLGISTLRPSSSSCLVNQTICFDVGVTNYGDGEAQNVPVRLYYEGEEATSEAVIQSIPAGQTGWATLSSKFHEAGIRTVTAQLPHDHLPADDQRTLALEIWNQTSVLIVEEQASRREHGRYEGGVFLKNAFVPVPPNQRGSWPIKTTTVLPSELQTVSLKQYSTVVLNNIQALSDAASKALDNYVRDGGGAMVFPGDRTDAAFYNEKLLFLPAKLGKVQGGLEGQFFTFKENDENHPVVLLWKNPAAGSLATAHFYRAFGLELKAADHDAKAPVTVMHYANGSPAIVEGTWGKGRVILFSSTADTSWNDLPVRPAFVPLVHRILGAVSHPFDKSLNLLAGEPYQKKWGADSQMKSATILKPGEKFGAQQGTTCAAFDVDGAPCITFDNTDLAGTYQVITAENKPESFAVGIDPRESRLEEFGNFKMFEPVASVIQFKPHMVIHEAVQKTRTSEIWPWVVMLALVTACGESFVARRACLSR